MPIAPSTQHTFIYYHNDAAPYPQSRPAMNKVKSQNRLSADTRVALLRRVTHENAERARRSEGARMQVSRTPLSPIAHSIPSPTSQIAALDPKYTLDAYKKWSTASIETREKIVQQIPRPAPESKKNNNQTTALRSPASPSFHNIAIVAQQGRRNALAHSPTKAELARLFAPQTIAAPQAFVLQPVPASRRRRSLSPPLTTIVEELPTRRYSLQIQQQEAALRLERTLPPLSTLIRLLASDLEMRRGGVDMLREKLQMRSGDLGHRRGRGIAPLVMFGH